MSDETKSLGMEPVPTSESNAGVPICPRDEWTLEQWDTTDPRLVRKSDGYHICLRFTEYTDDNKGKFAPFNYSKGCWCNQQTDTSRPHKQIVEDLVRRINATPKPTSTPHTVPLEHVCSVTGKTRPYAKEACSGCGNQPDELEKVLLGLIRDGFIAHDPLIYQTIRTRLSAFARHSPHWVKIEEGKPETWPEVEIEVIVALNSGERELGFFGADGHWYTGDWGRIIVTHWMPLPPAPPSEGETK
jgi:hypothetical protein